MRKMNKLIDNKAFAAKIFQCWQNYLAAVGVKHGVISSSCCQILRLRILLFSSDCHSAFLVSNSAFCLHSCLISFVCSFSSGTVSAPFRYSFPSCAESLFRTFSQIPLRSPTSSILHLENEIVNSAISTVKKHT